MPPTCAWCRAPLDERADWLAGRVRCARCGVATTHPWPDDATLEAAYADWYRPQAGRFSGPGDRILRATRARLARRLDAIAPAGAVLDVGAGDGTLVRALAARGREATGLERGAQAAAGSPAAPRLLDAELTDLDGPFAAIVMWHALEHLRDPGATLAAAAERLEPGGVLVIAVPNAGSLQAAAIGDDWLALDLPRHLTHITAPALRDRLRSLGLAVERESHLRGGQVAFGWLHGLLIRTLGSDLYDAIRRPEARRRPLTPTRRAATLLGAGALLPAALALTAVEAALRRGGSVYVEARAPLR